MSGHDWQATDLGYHRPGFKRWTCARCEAITHATEPPPAAVKVTPDGAALTGDVGLTCDELSVYRVLGS